MHRGCTGLASGPVNAETSGGPTGSVQIAADVIWTPGVLTSNSRCTGRAQLRPWIDGIAKKGSSSAVTPPIGDHIYTHIIHRHDCHLARHSAIWLPAPPPRPLTGLGDRRQAAQDVHRVHQAAVGEAPAGPAPLASRTHPNGTRGRANCKGGCVERPGGRPRPARAPPARPRQRRPRTGSRRRGRAARRLAAAAARTESGAGNEAHLHT
jgi:hypothetical protein